MVKLIAGEIVSFAVAAGISVNVAGWTNAPTDS
jgi:hypothetical protein